MNLGFGQQDMTLYQFRNLSQASYLNPAFSGSTDMKVSVGLPALSSTYFSYNNNAFDVDDLFASDYDFKISNLGNTGSTEFFNYLRNPAQITSGLAESNYLMTNLQIDLFHLQINKGKHSIGFNVTEKVSGMIMFPKSLFELVQNGNGGANLGVPQTINGIGPDFNHYREFGLSYSLKAGTKWTYGARVKLLSGMENLSVNNSEFTWVTDPQDYSWDISAAYSVNSSGLTNEALENYNIFSGRGNTGYGLDLGVEYQLNDAINLSAAVSDLGFINWTSNNVMYTTNDFNFQFDGIDILALNDSTAIGDLISETYGSAIDSINPILDSTSVYQTRLHPRVLIGGNYQLSEKINLGLLLHGQFFGPATKYAASVSASYNLGNAFSAVASYTATDNTYNNVGLGIMFDKGPVQMYAITDNILGVNVSAARNIHARVGVNLTFGKRAMQPEELDKGGDLITEAVMPEPEPMSAVETVSEPELEPDPIPVPVSPFIELFGEVKDKETNLELSGVIVDVYVTGEDGVEVGPSSRPFNSSHFVKQLDRTAKYRIVVKKAGYEDTEYYVFKDDMGELPQIRNIFYLTPKVLEYMPSPAEEEPVVMAYELTARTSLRAEATSQSTVLQRISEGTLMEVLEETNKYWWKVNLDGQVGYVKAAYLMMSSNPITGTYMEDTNSVNERPTSNYNASNEGTGLYYYLIDKTSLRSEATSQSTVLKRFRAGDEVELIEKTDKYWWKVIFDGQVGYVKAAKLQE
jgi:hypothetical protein